MRFYIPKNSQYDLRVVETDADGKLTFYVFKRTKDGYVDGSGMWNAVERRKGDVMISRDVAKRIFPEFELAERFGI